MADERDPAQLRDPDQTELAALKAERLLIWSALKEETSEAESAVLMQQLREYHEQIAALRERGVHEPAASQSESSPVGLEPFAPRDMLVPSSAPATLARAAPSQLPASAVDLSVDQREQERDSTRVLRLAVVFAGGMVVAAGILALLTFGPLAPKSAEVSTFDTVAGRTVTTGSSEAVGLAPTELAAADSLARIQAVVSGVGLTDVAVERNGTVILLSGSASSAAIRDAAVRAARELVGDGESIDASGVVLGPEVTTVEAGQLSDLQNALSRTVAQTPLVFTPGTTELTAPHLRILDGVGTILFRHPEAVVQVVGYTDSLGDPTTNTSVSLRRADSVRGYLIGLGIPEANLRSDARGEASASGSEGLASLERRVEFEVIGLSDAGAAASEGNVLRVAIVTPSPRDDLAFSQSMIDAVSVLGQQRGGVEMTITDNTFVPAEAGGFIQDYANQGYDLVIGHSTTFGAEILKIAPQYPQVAFAYGTGTDNFGLPNVYTYAVNTEEGAYVNGAMSSMLSTTKVIGIVGPHRIPETVRYEAGYTAGAVSQTPETQVLVTYTDSFYDLDLASEAAQAHIAAGADVLTGSSEMVVGAIPVVEASGGAWFGNQADQSPFAPNTVAAAQVYRWEVLLQQVVADIDSGVLNGRVLTANLANGGLSITYNDSYPLPPEIRQRGDELIAGIVAGSVVVPAG